MLHRIYIFSTYAQYITTETFRAVVRNA